jgi:hypothetical protein
LLVIVEGPDRTGKSTVCDQLCESTGWEIVHSGVPTRHPLQEYVLSLEGLDPRTDLILDRWHLGQWVYPQLYPKGRKTLSMEHWLWIELFLRARGAFLVVMNDMPGNIVNRVHEDTDSYLDVTQVNGCVTLFERARNYSILQKMPRTTRITDANWIKNVVRQIPQHDPEPYMLGMPPHRNFGIMLVGDELGRPNPPEATHQVPFAPYSQACGLYLMRALLTWPQSLLPSVQIVNSLRPDGAEEDLMRLTTRYRPRAVIALGQKAADRLAGQGVPHGKVRHPQYMRRFEHRRIGAYGTQILKEAGIDRP